MFSQSWFRFYYLISISVVGFILLLILEKTKFPLNHGNNIAAFDLFFMSVSATTSSGLATVDMENLSNPQLVAIIFIMFFGGDIFTSILFLPIRHNLRRRDITLPDSTKLDNLELEQLDDVDDVVSTSSSEPGTPTNKSTTDTATTTTTPNSSNPLIELMPVVDPKLPLTLSPLPNYYNNTTTITSFIDNEIESRSKSLKCLRRIVVGFLAVSHLLGSIIVLLYFAIDGNAKRILDDKGLNFITFSVFVAVSSFANCGLLPPNESMLLFQPYTFLSIVLGLLVLMGDTLFPPLLNLTILALRKIKNYKGNYKEEILDNLVKEGAREKLGFEHLFSRRESVLLTVSTLGFLGLQIAVYCGFHWDLEALKGMDGFDKVVNVAFQAVNTRHSGEQIFDLSTFVPAALLLTILMMYLPSHAFLFPKKKTITSDIEAIGGASTTCITNNNNNNKKSNKNWKLLVSVLPPQVLCLLIFVIAVCITEYSHMMEDPLNFSFLSIAFEATSAYGNVGLSIGYSCNRFRMVSSNNNQDCKDTFASLSGKWTRQGQVLIIILMLYGRFKKLTAKFGKAWMII